MRRPRLSSVLVSILVGAFYLLWYAIMVAAPLFAAWVASSIAAHRGGSVRVALASALLVFPLLPFVWEGVSAWRRSRQKFARKRILTLADRLVLRTLAVSLLFLGALFARAPQRAFVALNSRGDWMLDGRHSPRAEKARRALFRVATGSVWLYHLTDDNPFHEGGRPPPPPPPLPTHVVVRAEPTPDEPEPPPAPPPPRDPHAWPFEGPIHPLVTQISATEETSPEAVGRYLAAHEPDKWRLARAVHDYVADRVAYDVVSYRAHVYPPQDAETTLRTRLSVCAGYAALFKAIADAAGLNVVTVVGHARHASTDGMGEGHAWNAIKLDGTWYLIDTTWDAGQVDQEGFHKNYRTTYFLTPPEIFMAKHFPDEAQWQLLTPARTEGDYMRAPILSPDFFAYGMRLRSPDRAESDAHDTVDIVIDNPQRVALMVHASAPTDALVRCVLLGRETITARCRLRDPGAYNITIFASRERTGTLWGVGSLRVLNR